jgi:transglutaminase-like putative cysteine protease
MRYSIEHRTHIDFPSPVSEHQCEMRLTPRRNEHQRVKNFEVWVEPDVDLFEYTDAFGNRVHHFSVLEPHDSLETHVEMEVECDLADPFNYPLMAPEKERAWYEDRFRSDPSVWQYVIHESLQVPRPSALNMGGAPLPVWDRDEPLQTSLLKARDWVASFLAYRPGTTSTHASLGEAVRQRSGVCQDFAHLLISIARSWGLPARYVMGYLAPCHAGGPVDNQASHAWAEVMIPGAGWRGLDPTNGLVVNDTYIAVAVGRDSREAAPQHGSFKGVRSNSLPDVRLVVTQQNQ